MATAVKTILHDSVKLKVIQWIITSTDTDGAPYIFSGRYPDKSIHVFGTFGTGGVVKAQGTNEVLSPANWYNLNDPQGAEISINAAKIKEILENVYQFRPYLSAGTGTALTVILCLKG